MAVGHGGLAGWSWGGMEEGQLKGKSVLSRAFKIKLDLEGAWLQDSWYQVSSTKGACRVRRGPRISSRFKGWGEEKVPEETGVARIIGGKPGQWVH